MRHERLGVSSWIVSDVSMRYKLPIIGLCIKVEEMLPHQRCNRVVFPAEEPDYGRAIFQSIQ